ncbi:glucosaminidase domain-containing protein [Enterococcus sp. LJL51]|uniref:glucosaminidase domain-containing protein n=1 Tax=Enterococcus sp. LJL51 TaxID=3416656 RepID=UPI003CF0C53E
MKRKILMAGALAIIVSSAFNPVLVFGSELGNANPVEESTETTDSSTEESTDTSDTTEESNPGETGTTDSSTEPSVSAEPTPPVETPAPVPDTPAQPAAPAPAQPAAPAPVSPAPNYTGAGVDPILNLPSPINVNRDETTESFVRRIGEKARRIGQEFELYASVMIAQAILETGSGGSQLSQEPYFNLFGIKGDYEGQSVTFPTYEDDGSGNWYQINSTFKQYPGYTESFEDYAKLLKEGTEWNPTIYEGTWKEHAVSYQEAAKALTGVYATDTQYDQKLIAFIEEYELTEYDKAEPSAAASGIIITDNHPDSDFKDYAGESYSGAEYYAAGNCTQYVYNRIIQLDGYVDVNMGNGMDWGATGKARGYEVSHEPKAGTALCFQPGVAGADSTYGHVAFVEHVYEDGSILISEMNVAGLGMVSFRLLDKNTADIMTYITPK